MGKKMGRPSKITQIAVERGMSEVALMNELLARHGTYQGVAKELGMDIAAISRWADAHGAVKKTVITIPLVIEIPQS